MGAHQKKEIKRLKILSMGDAGVGKSSLIKRYCENTFTSEYISTIGIDYGVKPLVSDPSVITKINFWDIGGDAVYLDIRNEFYNDTHGAFLAFSVADRVSFDNIPKWIKEMNTFSNIQPVLFLVATKIDLKSRAVSYEEADSFAQSVGARYFETSAANNDGVVSMFTALFDASLQTQIGPESDEPQTIIVT